MKLILDDKLTAADLKSMPKAERRLGTNKYDPIVDIIMSQGYGIKGMGRFATEKDRFWAMCDIVMDFLYKRYPNEMLVIEADAQMKRESQTNKYAARKDIGWRHAVALPMRLDMALRAVYKDSPYPMNNKQFIRGMWTRYPKFRIADQF